MNQVVWVFGVSGAGKEAFLHTIGDDPKTRQALGWLGLPITVCRTSVDVIGQYAGDPITQQREGILPEVSKIMADVGGIALVKWQLVDSAAGRPERLMELLPEVTHCIVELRAPELELAERVEQKPWWNEAEMGTPRVHVARELAAVAEIAGPLAAKFGTEITVLNSGRDAQYVDGLAA